MSFNQKNMFKILDDLFSTDHCIRVLQVGVSNRARCDALKVKLHCVRSQRYVTLHCNLQRYELTIYKKEDVSEGL